MHSMLHSTVVCTTLTTTRLARITDSKAHHCWSSALHRNATASYPPLACAVAVRVQVVRW